MDIAYTWLTALTARRIRARITAPSTIAVFFYSSVGTLVAQCYKVLYPIIIIIIVVIIINIRY